MSIASGVAEILGAAVDAAAAAVDPARIEGEQLDLIASEDHLGLPDASEITSIQDELDCDVAAAVIEWRRRGRKGRKPGAKNRRTSDFAKYIAGFGPHPGVALARIVARPVDMLAAELGCSKIEALDRQIRCAAELLPYVEGKQPVQVQLSGNGHMTLIMGGAMPGEADPVALAGAPQLSFADDAETAEFQEVSDSGETKSE